MADRDKNRAWLNLLLRDDSIDTLLAAYGEWADDRISFGESITTGFEDWRKMEISIAQTLLEPVSEPDEDRDFYRKGR